MNPAEMVAHREAYRYVPARLIAAGSAEPDFVWGDLRLVKSLPSEKGWKSGVDCAQYASTDLDNFHCDLLRGSSEQKLHGLVSAVFWGFASGTDGRFTPGRALARAKWFAEGNARKPAQPADEISEQLNAAIQYLLKNDMGCALDALLKIRNLGVSFASKILMFAAPDRAAVYDDVIATILRHSDDLQLNVMATDLGATHSAGRQRQLAAYEKWCAYCKTTAKTLNATNSYWSDWNGAQEPWRAVDVERALFSKGRPKI